MMDKLKTYLDKPAQIVFEWSDPESEARAWLVINSLKGGAAGGGTRMRKGLTRNEVIDLAKTMEIKFSVCGPSIGGAKSGIDFDPLDSRKKEVLKRWYVAITPLLKNYYGTAGDLNIDEKTEVNPILQSLGVNHPQEGVLEGHFKYPAELKAQTLERLKSGCELYVRSQTYSPKPDTNEYTSIDLITGYGVSESVKIFYQLYKNQSLENKRVFIQGWGNVGAAAGWYLSKAGAKIIVIQDKDGYVLNESGFDYNEVTRFMNEKLNNTLQDSGKKSGAIPLEKLAELNIDIFIPAAASKLVKSDFINELIRNGLELISCGANVPFSEEGIFYGELSRALDHSVSLIPDFIANCGVARLFSYLMENKGPVTEEGIFQDISDTISKAIHKIHEHHSGDVKITQNAYDIYVGI